MMFGVLVNVTAGATVIFVSVCVAVVLLLDASVSVTA